MLLQSTIKLVNFLVVDIKTKYIVYYVKISKAKKEERKEANSKKKKLNEKFHIYVITGR